MPVTIIVGYIPTREGEAALSAAIEEAGRRCEPLYVVNVGDADVERDRRLLDERTVDELDERLRNSGVQFDMHVLVRGKGAAEEIIEAAQRLEASLIVIGLRHRSPTGKLIFGSQAQRVLLDAACPVLAVKASS